MKIVEKYIEAIKIFTDYVTISEWAIKFSEMYPDELQKANEQASNCWDAKNLASARIHTWPPDA